MEDDQCGSVVVAGRRHRRLGASFCLALATLALLSTLPSLDQQPPRPATSLPQHRVEVLLLSRTRYHLIKSLIY